MTWWWIKLGLELATNEGLLTSENEYLWFIKSNPILYNWRYDLPIYFYVKYFLNYYINGCMVGYIVWINKN